MINAHCIHSSLSELNHDFDLLPYMKFVRPIDYDFSLKVGSIYLIIGFIDWDGTLWVYCTPEKSNEVTISPAVMFDFNKNIDLSGMDLKITIKNRVSIEILPKNISMIENWFENYIDGDADIIKLIDLEIKNSHK